MQNVTKHVSMSGSLEKCHMHEPNITMHKSACTVGVDFVHEVMYITT